MFRTFVLAMIFSTVLPGIAQVATVKKVGPRYTSPTSGPEMY